MIDYQVLCYDSFGNFDWHGFRKFPTRREYFELFIWEENDIVKTENFYEVERKIKILRVRKDILRKISIGQSSQLKRYERRILRNLPWNISDIPGVRYVGKIFPRIPKGNKYYGFIRKRPSIDTPTIGDGVFGLKYIKRRWSRYSCNFLNMFRAFPVLAACNRQIGKSTRKTENTWLNAEQILDVYVPFIESFDFDVFPKFNDIDIRNLVLNSRSNLRKKGGLTSETGVGFGNSDKSVSRQASVCAAFEIADRLEKNEKFELPVNADVFGARGKKFFVDSGEDVKTADCRPLWMTDHIVSIFQHCLVQMYNSHFMNTPIHNPIRLKKLETGNNIYKINSLLGYDSVSIPFDVSACDASHTKELKIATNAMNLMCFPKTHKWFNFWKLMKHFDIDTPVIVQNRHLMYFSSLNHTGKPFTAIDTSAAVTMVISCSLKSAMDEVDDGLWFEYLNSNKVGKPVLMVGCFGDDTIISTTVHAHWRWKVLLKRIQPRIEHFSMLYFGMELENPFARDSSTPFPRVNGSPIFPTFSWRGQFGQGYNLLKTSRTGDGNVCVPIKDLINRFLLCERVKGEDIDMRINSHFSSLSGIGPSGMDTEFAKHMYKIRYGNELSGNYELQIELNKKSILGVMNKTLKPDDKTFDVFDMRLDHVDKYMGKDLITRYDKVIRMGILSMFGSHAISFKSFRDPEKVITEIEGFIRSDKFRFYKKAFT